MNIRRVWRYQRDNQNPLIDEGQATQCPKEKVQKDKQRSRKHTHKTKDRVTRTPLKTEGELRCSGRVSSSCSTRVSNSLASCKIVTAVTLTCLCNFTFYMFIYVLCVLQVSTMISLKIDINTRIQDTYHESDRIC